MAAMVKSPSQTQDKFIVRLPDGMREQIRAAAKANGRTMTAEIVARLEHTFLEKRLYEIEGTAGAAFELATDLAFKDVAAVIRRLDDIEKRLAEVEGRPWSPAAERIVTKPKGT